MQLDRQWHCSQPLFVLVAAMLDGRGNVVRPDWIFIYYKQVASQDHPACAGKCINIPNGLRFIYGWDQQA